MKKFLVLYYSSVPASEQMKAPPDQMKAGMDLWMAWSKKAGSGLVDFGLPLVNPMKLSGGTASKSNSQAVGYSILQAESAKAIEGLLREHPHFKAPGASIEYLEMMQMPGM